jgi:hypothetical protein
MSNKLMRSSYEAVRDWSESESSSSLLAQPKRRPASDRDEPIDKPRLIDGVMRNETFEDNTRFSGPAIPKTGNILVNFFRAFWSYAETVNVEARARNQETLIYHHMYIGDNEKMEREALDKKDTYRVAREGSPSPDWPLRYPREENMFNVPSTLRLADTEGQSTVAALAFSENTNLDDDNFLDASSKDSTGYRILQACKKIGCNARGQKLFITFVPMTDDTKNVRQLVEGGKCHTVMIDEKTVCEASVMCGRFKNLVAASDRTWLRTIVRRAIEKGHIYSLNSIQTLESIAGPALNGRDRTALRDSNSALVHTFPESVNPQRQTLISPNQPRPVRLEDAHLLISDQTPETSQAEESQKNPVFRVKRKKQVIYKAFAKRASKRIIEPTVVPQNRRNKELRKVSADSQNALRTRLNNMTSTISPYYK